MTHRVWQGQTLAWLAFYVRFSASVRTGTSSLESKNLGWEGVRSSECEWVCTTERQWRRGHWTVSSLNNGSESASAFPVYGPRQYFAVHAGGCTPKDILPEAYMPRADVVPLFNEEDPTSRSQLHVYFSPMLVASLRNRYSHYRRLGLQVCGYDEMPKPGDNTPGTCLCEMALPEPYLSLVATLPFAPFILLSKMDQLEHDCHSGIPLFVELVLEFIAVCILAALAHTGYSLITLPPIEMGNEALSLTEEMDSDESDRQGPEREEEHREGPEEESMENDGASQPRAPPTAPYAVVIKSPRKCCRECLSKLLGFVLIMISLQTLIVEFIMRAVRPLVMYISMGVVLTFSIYSITRFMLVMAQEELVYAALARSIAVTKPPPPKFAQYAECAIMVLFVLMLLGLAVRADVNHLIFYFDTGSTSGKVAFTTLLALAGPIWRVLREHRRAADTNAELVKSHVKLNLQGLSALMQQRASEVVPDAVDIGHEHGGSEGTTWTRLEMALSCGKLRFMPLSVMIKAGRRQESIWEACSWYAGGEGWEARASSAFNASTFESQSSDGVQRRYQPWDIHWHGRGVYELTGSRWAFTKIPLYCAAAAVVMSVTLFQLVSYACLVPELTMLSMQAGGDLHLQFKPWRYQYVAELDVSYRALTMAMSYDRRTTRKVEVDDGSEGSERRGWKPEDVLYVPVDGKFPQVVHIYVESIQGDNWNYSVRFMPTGLLATRLGLTPNNNASNYRFISLARLPEAALAIPPDSVNVSVEVFLTDYMLTPPVSPCKDPYQLEQGQAAMAKGHRRSILTVFCQDHEEKQMPWQEVKVDQNEEDKMGNCQSLCRLRGDCVYAFSGRGGGCFYVVPPVHREEGEVQTSNRLQSRVKQNSKICSADDRTQCKGSTVSENDSKLIFDTFDLEGGSSNIRLVLMLGLSPNLQQLHTRYEYFHLARGMPAPVEVMAHVKLRRTALNGSVVEVTAPTTVEPVGNTYVVTLHDYKPLQVTGELIFLYLAPLLPDPEGFIKWPIGTDDLSGPCELPVFERCSESRYNSNRFRICINAPDRIPVRWGQWKDVARINLEPWTPTLMAGFGFQVRHAQFEGQSRSFQVILRLQGVQSPTEWPFAVAMKHNQELCGSGETIIAEEIPDRPVWWPRSGLPALLADARTTCKLALDRCNIVEYDDSDTRLFAAGHKVEVIGKLRGDDLSMLAFLDGYRKYDIHRYLSVLSCAVQGNISWLQDHEFDNRGETLRFIVRDDRERFQEEVSISVRHLFGYIVRTDSVELLRQLCSWVGNVTDTSQQMPILTNMFQMLIRANATTREVSSEVFKQAVLCVAGHPPEMPLEQLRELAEFAVRAAVHVNLLSELFVLQQQDWKEAVVAKLIEAQCGACFPVLKGQADAVGHISRLQIKIRPFTLESTLSAFKAFVIELRPQPHHLGVIIDRHDVGGHITPWGPGVGSGEAQIRLKELGDTEALAKLESLSLEGFTLLEVGAILKGWTDRFAHRWKTLKSLSIANLPAVLDLDTFDALGRVLTATEQGLTSLRLSGRVLDDNLVKQFASTLQNGTLARLHNLDLSNNRLSDGTGPALLTILFELPDIFYFNLSHNALNRSVLNNLWDVALVTGRFLPHIAFAHQHD